MPRLFWYHVTVLPYVWWLCISRWMQAPISGYRTTAVNYCKLGCTASVCNKLIPSAVVGSGNEGKDAMERCTSGCHDLCTKSSTDIAKVHNA
nr:thionin-2.2 isoform X3 [Aegilops tauschii subsp. strangulata]